MTANFSKPILATSLPRTFRKIRLELARERGHPDGDRHIAYTLVAPLDAASRIDAESWKGHRDAARVVRQRPNEPDQAGHLVRTHNGGWAFHYEPQSGKPDETGYRFADEKFAIGEYVSVVEDGKPHVFKVVSVERL
jgi:hypothetical protein